MALVTLTYLLALMQYFFLKLYVYILLLSTFIVLVELISIAET